MRDERGSHPAEGVVATPTAFCVHACSWSELPVCSINQLSGAVYFSVVRRAGVKFGLWMIASRGLVCWRGKEFILMLIRPQLCVSVFLYFLFFFSLFFLQGSKSSIVFLFCFVYLFVCF